MSGRPVLAATGNRGFLTKGQEGEDRFLLGDERPQSCGDVAAAITKAAQTTAGGDPSLSFEVVHGFHRPFEKDSPPAVVV